MSKFMTAVALFIFLLITACGSPEGTSRSGKKSLIAEKYAPANSAAMFKFSSLDQMFTVFDIAPESMPGYASLPFPEKQQITAMLGFDPFNVSEYKKIGIDPSKEFGMVLSELKVNGTEPEKTVANFAFILPVNGNQTYDMLRQMIFGLENEMISVAESGSMIILKVSDDADILGTVKSDGDYLIINIAVNSDMTAADYFKEGKKLADSPNFKETAGEVSMGSDLVFYFDSKIIFENNSEAMEHLAANPYLAQGNVGSLDFLKHIRGSAVTADISSPDLSVSSVSFVGPENIMHKLTKAQNDKSVITGFEKKPAVLLAFVLNAEEYLNYILKTLPEESASEFELMIENYRNMIGIDLRKDFINELAGSINFGIFDAPSINMMQYNTVLNFNMKNRIKFLSLIEKIAPFANMQKMSADAVSDLTGGKNPGSDVDVFSINMGMAFLYVIVDGNNVSLCTSREMSADILDKTNPDYLSKIDKQVAGKLKNDHNYLYLDAAEAYIGAKTIYKFIASMSGSKNILNAEADSFAKNFEYIYAYANFEGGKARSEFTVKTKFKKPFFTALKEEIGKLK